MMLFRGEPTPDAQAAAEGRMSDWMRHALASDTAQPMLAARGRWFTDDLEIARWYAADACGDAHIVGIEISDHVAEAFRVSNLAGPLADGLYPQGFSRDPEREFMLPSHIADRARPVDA